MTSQDHSDIQRLREALDAERQQRLELQQQLERINADFEQFVSTAAHNLREPLREVTVFSDLLVEENASLDPDACAYLKRIRCGAAAMQALLADVVDYWSLGGRDRPSSTTNMEAVLSHALRSMNVQGAAFTHDPLPGVRGDFDGLAKVLRHVIGNAIQYSGGPAAVVHISVKRVEEEWQFSVQDNGPGIDRAFHARVFLPFKRLHGREIPGHGLGLAFCRKALEWHGGRIWVESAPGAGSVFCFTLPAVD